MRTWFKKIPDPSKSIEFGSTNSGKYINVMYSCKFIYTYWQIMTPELTQNYRRKLNLLYLPVQGVNIYFLGWFVVKILNSVSTCLLIRLVLIPSLLWKTKLISHANPKVSYLYFGRSEQFLLLKARVFSITMWSGPANVSGTLGNMELFSFLGYQTHLHWHAQQY